MNLEQFIGLTLEDLEVITRIDKGNWSKFFHGQNVHELTLKKAGERLNMPTHILLEAINKKRQEKLVQRLKPCETK
jgi:hypothetical protein